MITHHSGTRPWWNPGPPPCRDCEEQGNHVDADIQFHGVWVCNHHHNIRIQERERLWNDRWISSLR